MNSIKQIFWKETDKFLNLLKWMVTTDFYNYYNVIIIYNMHLKIVFTKLDKCSKY